MTWSEIEPWLSTHRARLSWHSGDRVSVEYWLGDRHIIVVGRVVEDRAETACELVARVMGMCDEGRWGTG